MVNIAPQLGQNVVFSRSSVWQALQLRRMVVGGVAVMDSVATEAAAMGVVAGAGAASTGLGPL
jgi:hypothetical protein